MGTQPSDFMGTRLNVCVSNVDASFGLGSNGITGAINKDFNRLRRFIYLSYLAFGYCLLIAYALGLGVVFSRDSSFAPATLSLLVRCDC